MARVSPHRESFMIQGAIVEQNSMKWSHCGRATNKSRFATSTRRGVFPCALAKSGFRGANFHCLADARFLDKQYTRRQLIKATTSSKK